MTRNRVTRPGITLVEMMVAMALTLGIMLILTESFKMALDFVRGANATGNLIYQLHGAGLLMDQEVAKAPHFLSEPGRPFGGVRLGDQRLDQPGWTPPNAGFFNIVSTGASRAAETTDTNGFNVNQTASQHGLHFTSILPGGSDQNVYTAVVTINGSLVTYTSRAAEVAYFLAGPVGQTGGANSQPLYNLIRRQRLVALTADDANTLASALSDPTAAEVISVSTTGTVNTLASLAANPGNRMTPAQIPITTSSTRYGEDIVATNVLSFEVLADWTPNAAKVGSTQPPLPYNSGNTDAPYDFLDRNNGGGGTFDTTSAGKLFVRVKSLQVTLRVFDPRMKYTRQNTWKFGM